MYWHELIHERNIHPEHDYSMLNEISLDSVINQEFKAISKDTPVTDFYTILSKSQANIFAVLTANGILEGVVLMDDVRKQLFDAEQKQDTVADLMIAPPAVIDYEEPVSEVMELFDGLDVWQLPVIKNGVFMGFVSKSALLSKYREVIIKQHDQADIFAR